MSAFALAAGNVMAWRNLLTAPPAACQRIRAWFMLGPRQNDSHPKSYDFNKPLKGAVNVDRRIDVVVGSPLTSVND